MSKSKYRNIRCQFDGYKFDSKKERQRYMELKLLVKAGEIEHLQLQVPFDLHVKGKKIGKYVADFVYWSKGERITEDVKGVKTAIFKWKSKHMKAEYDIDIFLT